MQSKLARETSMNSTWTTASFLRPLPTFRL